MPIILVEDERSTREFEARMLRESGYEVNEALDGFRASELLDPARHRLVVSDSFYPSFEKFMEGVKGKYPVILTSGYPRSHEAVQERIKLVEPVEFIEKPFTRKAFLDAVERHYKR